MKNISEYINEDFHKLNSIEMDLTNEFFKILPLNNLAVNIDVNGYEINFSDPDFAERKQCVGIIIENYIKYFINKNTNNFYEESNIENILNNYTHNDFGTYDNYDYLYKDIPFEIKCSTNNRFYLTNNQKNRIGPDSFYILITFELHKNNIILSDIIVKQAKNCKISGNYIIA